MYVFLSVTLVCSYIQERQYAPTATWKRMDLKRDEMNTRVFGGRTSISLL